MTRFSTGTVAALVALVLAAMPVSDAEGQGVAVHASVTLPPELDRVLRDYERGWRAGRADSVAMLFTADGFALPNGRPPARGHAAIVATYAGPGGDLRLRALAYGVSDSVGYIIGAYRYGAADEDTGKFVLALRKQLGRWMIAADMDNSSPRRPPAPGN